MTTIGHRLAVNINNECADALRRVTSTRGITTTEAIRRAIALLDYFESGCARCGHPRRWHDPVDDDMCIKAACYCQKPQRLPCLMAGCKASAVLGGWCEEHQ